MQKWLHTVNTNTHTLNSTTEAIRSCKHLYLGSISEPEDNSLRIVLLEAMDGDPPTEEQLTRNELRQLSDLLKGARAVVHGPGCRVFELVWPSYVGYAVQNESYARAEPEESVGEGRLLVVYADSVYLRYLSNSTFASTEYPGPFKHWAVHCLNHVVNVASVDEPVVTLSQRD